MTDGDAHEIAVKATRGAYVTSSIPGGIERAENCAKRARKIMRDLSC